MSDTFHRIFPLYKVVEEPDGTCTVYARGCAEEPDVTDQIMDYDTTVPHIKKWSDDTFRRSGGKSYGNIRSMHQAIASGKVDEPITYNDAEKAVDLCMKVVDPVEAKKCREGVYSGVSIGGHYAKIWRDPKNPKLQRYTGVPKEFSLVDAPAIPSATFQMVKLDGTVEVKKMGAQVIANSDVVDDKVPTSLHANESPAPTANVVAPDPRIPEPQYIGGPMVEVGGEPVAPNPMVHGVNILTPSVQELVLKFNESVERMLEVQKRQAAERSKSVEMLKSVGERYGIRYRSEGLIAPPTGYPTDFEAYGDPANYAYRYDGPGEVRVAVKEFNMKKWLGKYDLRESHILGRRIASRATTVLGLKHVYDPRVGKIAKLEVTVNKADQMAGVVADLKGVAQGALEHIDDPQHVMNALHQILAGLDVSDDASSVAKEAKPDATPVTVPSQAAKAAPSSVPSGTYEKADAPASTAASTDATTAPSSAPTGTAPTAKKAEEEVSIAKMVADALEVQLAPVLKDLAGAIAALRPMDKNLPIGNLNPLQTERVSVEQSPLEKALTGAASAYAEGIKPDVFLEVMKASGGDIANAQDAAVKLAQASLAKRGFTSGAKIQMLSPDALAQLRANGQS